MEGINNTTQPPLCLFTGVCLSVYWFWTISLRCNFDLWPFILFFRVLTVIFLSVLTVYFRILLETLLHSFELGYTIRSFVLLFTTTMKKQLSLKAPSMNSKRYYGFMIYHSSILHHVTTKLNPLVFCWAQVFRQHDQDLEILTIPDSTSTSSPHGRQRHLSICDQGGCRQTRGSLYSCTGRRLWNSPAQWGNQLGLPVSRRDGPRPLWAGIQGCLLMLSL